jgi:O-antigen/teichoic acid export membrane protein
VNRSGRGSFGSHAAYSLVAATLGALIALGTLPYIVSRLGLEGYGLLSLLAVASAYVGILDFGFSWTSSRFLADALERRDESMLAGVLRASVALYVVIGILGGAAISLAAGPLVDNVFNVPQSARGAGIEAARLIGLGFPFAMLQIFAVSALRGARRFDLTALLQLGGTAGTSLAMVVALALGGHLVATTAALAGSQVAVAVLALAATKWVLPHALSLGRIDRGLLRRLAHFSTRVMVANLGSQLLYLPNRLAVGVLLPLGAVGVFSVPLALAQRLQFVPAAVVTAALPTMTAAVARHDAGAFWKTFWKLTGIVAALLLPISALAFIWGSTILRTWFSSAFTSNASWVLRLALIAVLLNALTATLAVACDSAGAPGVSAAASMVAGAVNVALAFGLTAAYGIVGSAVALTISLGVLGLVIVALWHRADLPDMQLPNLRGFSRARIGFASALASAWLIGTAALEPEADSRLSLILLGTLVLASAYGAIAIAVGPRRLAAWTFQRTTASNA